MTAGLTAGPFDDVVASEASLKRFLHGLPGVDQVGAENRVARLATRSIKTTAKKWALDLVDLVDGPDDSRGPGHAGQGAGDVRQGDASRPE